MTEVTLWHDYCRPETVLGTRSVHSPAAAAELYAEGARHAVLPDLVDLAAGPEIATVRALALVRDLTAWGIAVDWRLRLPADAEMWPALSHLHPPAEVVGNAEIRDRWRADYHFCKCVDRHGPGFVEIRDFRSGRLRKIIIGDPRYRRTIEDLRAGCPLADLPDGIARELAAAGLIGVVGESAWWLPYRVRRWPLASDII
jgi:hypothetical protein